MREPDWSDFKVLLALGRSGSVSGASRILGIDGSTVSRRLAAAEKAMGATLIVRGGREFAFTAEGRSALEAAEAMDAAVNAAMASVRTSRAELQGIVRVAVFPSLVEFLRPFPQLVTERHPGLSVELGSARAVVDLARGDADIAVRVDHPMPADLIVRHTFELGLALYASTSYLDKAGRPTDPEELRDHQLVLYNAEFSSYPFAGWIEQFADNALPVVRVDSVEMARTLITADGGIGVLWCCHGDSIATLERVLPGPVSSTKVNVVYHRSLRGTTRVKTVADLLIALLVENREVLSGHLVG
jgi:DNA-binding transcriptional LysR family regulator